MTPRSVNGRTTSGAVVALLATASAAAASPSESKLRSTLMDQLSTRSKTGSCRSTSPSLT